MGKLSLAVRTFLLFFLPLCLVLFVIFAAINFALRQKIRGGLREYVQTAERLLDKVNESDSRRAAQVAALLTENAGLKAAIGLLREADGDQRLRDQVRRTIEDQLRDLHGLSGYQLVAISDSQDRILASL